MRKDGEVRDIFAIFARKTMGYYRSFDSWEGSCFFTAMSIWISYFVCFIILILLSVLIRFAFGNTFVVTYIMEHQEISSFVMLVISFIVFRSYCYYEDNIGKWKLTQEEKDTLYRYKLKGVSRRHRKRLAFLIKTAPGHIFCKLSSENIHKAIEEYICENSIIYNLNSEDKMLFTKTMLDAIYSGGEDEHTLREWEIILTEKRIERLKYTIRYERNRFHKHIRRSDDAIQADLLNMSYNDYKRYNSMYKALQKVTEEYGLNSKEYRSSLKLTIDRIGDFQEWKDLVTSKESLNPNEPKEKGSYATYFTNILSNTTNTVNLYYTDGSFFIMAYFDRVTFEERDSFIHNKVLLYMYYFDFVPFLVFEFARLRFAVPINLKDLKCNFNDWISSKNDEVLVNLVDSDTGRIVATRSLKLKSMEKIKKRLSIQKPFEKLVMDNAIRQVANKSLDELVYNGCVLEEIKGDSNYIEQSFL